MFIDTLEFTIPIDLCSLYATLQQEARSQLEFPASVNSYGTTQDANVLVALRANKVTFKVDGVSSNASIISKSECKTLKLSVFDVDRSLMQKSAGLNNSINVPVQQTSPISNSGKRHHEQSVSYPSAKSSRTSYSESPRPRSPAHRRSQSHTSPRPSENSQTRTQSDTVVNVKQEPEDPDLIEIEPDPEPDEVVPKKETPYMQIDYSSEVPHTQTSQSSLERVSFPPTSHSQSSSSFNQNVPHVPDYSEPGPSQPLHGEQSADDFLVFQDDNDYADDNEDAEYSNDDQAGLAGSIHPHNEWSYSQQGFYPASQGYANPVLGPEDQRLSANVTGQDVSDSVPSHQCEECGKTFTREWVKKDHMTSVHRNVRYTCGCGKVYRYQRNLRRHMKTDGCPGPKTWNTMLNG